MCRPLQVRKGRVNLVLGLCGIGKSVKEVQTISGCGATTIQKYLDLYEAGKKIKSAENFEGKAINQDDLCRLYGLLAGK